MRCLICSNPKIDQAHIKTKKSGGPNEDFNYMPLCRNHHQEQHRIGILTFMEKYPAVMKYLKEWGWEIIENGSYQKLWNAKLNTN